MFKSGGKKLASLASVVINGSNKLLLLLLGTDGARLSITVSVPLSCSCHAGVCFSEQFSGEG